jgi:hypothetical protein
MKTRKRADKTDCFLKYLEIATIADFIISFHIV